MTSHENITSIPIPIVNSTSSSSLHPNIQLTNAEPKTVEFHAIKTVSSSSVTPSLSSLTPPPVIIKPISPNPPITSKNLPFTFSLETPSFSSGTLDKYLKNFLGNESSSAVPDLLKPNTLTTSSPNVNDHRKEGGLSQVHLPPQPITINNGTDKPVSMSVEPSHDIKTISNIETSSSSNPFTLPNYNDSMNAINTPPNIDNMELVSQPGTGNTNSNTTEMMVIPNSNGELIPIPKGQTFLDITEYLNMPQSEAAKKLGVPPSTMSKRWREAVRQRKWPYRVVCKIDKEIMTLLHNVPQGANAPPLSEDIESALGNLLRKRQEELRPVVIRL